MHGTCMYLSMWIVCILKYVFPVGMYTREFVVILIYELDYHIIAYMHNMHISATPQTRMTSLS